ncbi:MAG: hypothetical protein M3P24_07005 [Gemmatimonadota bacterium]|nr:hypothetical protein [Gemmatimonadota bacterium]
MRKNRLFTFALAALVGLAACGGGDSEQEADPGENPEINTTPVPDQPAPAITNPASPSPTGTDVGAVGNDVTTAPAPGDTAAGKASHP